MLMNIIMSTCLYPTILIVFLVMNGQSSKNAKMLFGVRTTKELLEQPELDDIRKQYKKGVRNILILFMVIPPFFFFTKHVSIQFSLWMIWFLGGIVAAAVPYARANKKVLAIKDQLLMAQLQEHASESTSAKDPKDLVLSKDKRTSVTYHETQLVRTVKLLPFLLPLLVTVAGFLAILPINRIAIDVYKYSSGTLTILTPCFIGLAFWMDHLPSIVISEDSSINTSYNRARKAVWSNFWLQISWINTILVLLLTLVICLDFHPPLMLILLTSAEAFLSIALMIRVSKKNKQIDSHYEIMKSSDFETDDDHYWIWGMFYNNPSDHRTMVDKRFGIGMTCNMATRTGKITIWVAILALIWIPFMCLWMILEDFTPMHVTLAENAIVCTHLKKDYEIPVDTITEITVMNELPSRSKVSGTGTDTLEKGKYQSSKIGKYRSFINPEEGAFLLIRTTGETYLISGENEEETMEVYEKINK